MSVDDTNYLPPSVRVADINLPAGFGATAVAGKVGKGEQVFSVLDEGAVADATDAGGFDNTAAFQAAMDKAWGNGRGGTLLIPPGAYRLHGYVRVRSNVRIIGYGATIRKYSGATTYSAFQALSAGAQGYGSGATNVTFEGLTFRGKFGTNSTGNAVTLHHAQGVTFRKCNWSEAVLSGHAIDLLGCDGVLVDDCTFKGFSAATDRGYVEAIQVDYSMASGGGTDTTASFDGLPTVNVTVQNSRFLPLTVGATYYPAPNPIGSHSRVVGRWLENIKFDNNYVEGGASNTATEGFEATNRGWIHFLCTRNVRITRNVFKNVGGVQTRVVFCNPINTGTAVADVQNPNASSVSMPVMPMENFTFDGNTLIGFTNQVEDNLVDVRGTDASAGGINARRIWITNNTLRDSTLTPGASSDFGSFLTYLQDVSGATVAGNELENAAGCVRAFRSKRITVSGGNLTNISAYAGIFNACTDTKIANVNVDGHGGGWWFYGNCIGIDVSGGSMLNGRADALKKKHFSLSGATEYSIRNMRIPATGNGFTSAFDIYNTSTKGKVKDIFATGWGSDAALVSFGSGSSAELANNVY